MTDTGRHLCPDLELFGAQLCYRYRKMDQVLKSCQMELFQCFVQTSGITETRLLKQSIYIVKCRALCLEKKKKTKKYEVMSDVFFPHVSTNQKCAHYLECF